MFNTDRNESSGNGVRVWLRRHIVGISVPLIGLLIVVGVFASNGWLGNRLAKNAPSGWNPFAPPSPSPTPQLSKEYVYAGSRLLAVEDTNANAAPPADLAVWRPSTGMWYVLGGPGSQQTSHQWGQNGDVPVQGDYDGDGKADHGVWSNGTWLIRRSSDGGTTSLAYGQSGDELVPNDYDGDGKVDIAVWRPSPTKTCVWYIRQSATQTDRITGWGSAGDIPVPAFYRR